MPIASAALGAVGSIVSGNRAARAQENAANAQIASNERIYESQTELAAPYREGGGNALAALQYELGLGPRPVAQSYTIEELTRPGSQPGNALAVFGGEGRGGATGFDMLNSPGATGPQNYYMVGDQEFDSRDAAQAWIDSQPGNFDYRGYESSPWYDFQLEQGQQAIDGSAAARGNLFSGATLQAQQQMGQGLASADYGSYLSRLTGLSGMGQAAAAGQAAQAGNMGVANSNALGAMGNAQAANAINTGNALAGLANNVGGWYGYQAAQGNAPSFNLGGNSPVRPQARPWA